MTPLPHFCTRCHRPRELELPKVKKEYSMSQNCKFTREDFQRAVASAVAAEREACAQIADEWKQMATLRFAAVAGSIAKEIRARSTKKG